MYDSIKIRTEKVFGIVIFVEYYIKKQIVKFKQYEIKDNKTILVRIDVDVWTIRTLRNG